MFEMKKRILIVDDIHKVFLDKLRSADVTFDYQPEFTKRDTLDCISQYHGLVIRSKFQVDNRFIDRAEHLSFIARGGAGMDNIDEQYAEGRGISLINAPEGNSGAVAEHMIGMLLSLMNNLNRSNAQVRSGLWMREENRGHELSGRTIALIGYGNNGQSMARKLSGFDVKIIAYDKYKTGFSDRYVTEVSMEEIVRQADVLSYHIPLTRETKGMLDEEYLFHFRKPFYLLMGARGQIVNMQAVLQALDAGKIIGAAFDVLPVERFPELAKQVWYTELIGRDNVLLSPHIAGWTVESYYKIADVLADKVVQFLKLK